jgi:hypothetical protein
VNLNPLNDRRTAVYRLFNRDDVLLYVGVSWNPKSRIPSHQDKPWWPQVAKSTIDLHPDRATALRAEAVAIVEESPLYNLAVPDPEGVRAPRQYDLPRDLSGRTWPEAMRSAGIRPQKSDRPPSEVEQQAAIKAWLRWKQEAGEA